MRHYRIPCLAHISSRPFATFSNPARAAGAALASILALRIIRAWNQTGQKHAGKPDIARHFLPAHTPLLWILVFATYVDIIQRISRNGMTWASRRFATAVSIVLGFAAFGFKIAFTDADAPELLVGGLQDVLMPMRDTSLVAQARAVFLCIGFIVIMTITPLLLQISSSRLRLRGMLNKVTQKCKR